MKYNSIRWYMKTYQIADYPAVGKNYGSFDGETPMSAAKKAFKNFSKKINLEENKFLDFTLSDEGGKHFEYVGARIKLDSPATVVIGNKSFTIYYKTIVIPKSKFSM